jgi:hypothetical protein
MAATVSVPAPAHRRRADVESSLEPGRHLCVRVRARRQHGTRDLRGAVQLPPITLFGSRRSERPSVSRAGWRVRPCPARSPDPPSQTRERRTLATTPCCATGQAHGATSAPRHSRRPRGPDSTKMGVLGSCGSPPCIISSAHRTTLRRSGSEAQDLTEPDRRGLAPPERHCSTRCRR